MKNTSSDRSMKTLDRSMETLDRSMKTLDRPMETLDRSMKTMESLMPTLDLLKSRQETPDQGTVDWHSSRNKYITASVCATAAGLKGPAAQETLLLEKATNGDFVSYSGGYYTNEGKLFEPITNMIYEKRNNCKIHNFGLIRSNHPEYTFLAASTDGVTCHMKNIEIKTLPSRQITDKIKIEYYHQMQQQMFCLELKETDFIEAKYTKSSTPFDSPPLSEFGAIIEIVKDDGTLDYIWSDVYKEEGESLNKWHKETLEVLETSSTDIYVRTIYWTLDEYLCRLVPYDPNWITDIGPKLKKFWTMKANLEQDAESIKTIKDKKKKKTLSGCML